MQLLPLIPQPLARFIFLVVTFGLVAVPARAVDLLMTRTWKGPEDTRVVVDLSGPAEFEHHTRDDPARVVVEIPGGQFRFPLETIAIDENGIRRVRFNVLKKTRRAQIVIDLENSMTYDVFLLEKVDSKPDRLVIEIHRATAPEVATPQDKGDDPKSSENHPGHRMGPDRVGDFRVLIDAGHGGEDPGRINPSGIKEKDLALTFARSLQSQLNRRPGYRAELTRSGDYFMSLARRRTIAEREEAHLYVSLHFNAAPSPAANGTEVFFVSLDGATDRALQELEEVENSADLIGGVHPADESTAGDVTKMIVELRQNDCVERSQRLATILRDRIASLKGIEARRVKQANFAVLKSLFIPAVLVEIGFLTNESDLRFVQSRRNRTAYVDALADGIVAYCEEVEIPRLGWRMHVVSRGETLGEIAQQYAMDPETLREANDLPRDQDAAKLVGRRLRVRSNSRRRRRVLARRRIGGRRQESFMLNDAPRGMPPGAP